MAAVSTIWRRDFRNFCLLNSAFITLLPKKEDADHVGDFRPISLVHSFAKLVTKVLANRLRGHLDQLVSKSQSAFIKESIRINCIELLGLHHLFYKGAAGPLGLQLCASPGATSPGCRLP
jgi:hypothetical protein